MWSSSSSHQNPPAAPATVHADRGTLPVSSAANSSTDENVVELSVPGLQTVKLCDGTSARSVEVDVNRTLQVSEIFGPTFQGEGPDIGRRAFFLRLGLCNLHCTWCDTPYTWDWSGRNGTTYTPSQELKTQSIRVILEQLVRLGMSRGDLLVISGGEPMIQKNRLRHLIFLAKAEYRVDIAIETAGTIPPDNDWPMHRWVVSPKLSHSGNDDRRAIRWEALRMFRAAGAHFKFVVRWQARPELVSDLGEVYGIAMGVGIPTNRVWLMPEGKAGGDVLDGSVVLMNDRLVAEHRFNVSTRLHTLVWGNERAK